jgi:hypothetical protein
VLQLWYRRYDFGIEIKRLPNLVESEVGADTRVTVKLLLGQTAKDSSLVDITAGLKAFENRPMRDFKRNDFSLIRSRLLQPAILIALV